MYSKKAIKHFKNPKFAGILSNADAEGQEGNMKCGDVMKFYIKVKDNIIKDIRFQTYGCIGAIASSDILCGLVKGKTLDNALKVTYADIVKQMGNIPPVKLHCAVLGINTLKKTIQNYKKEIK